MQLFCLPHARQRHGLCALTQAAASRDRDRAARAAGAWRAHGRALRHRPASPRRGARRRAGIAPGGALRAVRPQPGRADRLRAGPCPDRAGRAGAAPADRFGNGSAEPARRQRLASASHRCRADRRIARDGRHAGRSIRERGADGGGAAGPARRLPALRRLRSPPARACHARSWRLAAAKTTSRARASWPGAERRARSFASPCWRARISSSTSGRTSRSP